MNAGSLRAGGNTIHSIVTAELPEQAVGVLRVSAAIQAVANSLSCSLIYLPCGHGSDANGKSRPCFARRNCVAALRLICTSGCTAFFVTAFAEKGEFMEQAEKAREKAQQGGGVFQEKFQELKQA